MYTCIDEYDNQVNLYAEYEDLCYLCANVEVCPFIAAFCQEVVIPRYESIKVENCGMYEKLILDKLICL